MAAPTTVLVVNKRFNYRGTAEEWANIYMLTGPTPADSGAWRTLFDALVAEEKKLYSSLVNVVGGYGYNKVPVKGDHAIWSVDLDIAPNTIVPGTYTTGGLTALPGDTAMWVRWKLDRLSIKGKPVYLRKYFHDVYSNAVDQINTSQKTALTNFGGKMRDGTFLDARVITDHLGTAVLSSGISSNPTTRTLKRRGKRPTS